MSSGLGRSGGLISKSVELLWSVELRKKSSYLSFSSELVWFRKSVSASEPLTGGSSCRSSEFSNDILIRLSCLSRIFGEIGTICVILASFGFAWPWSMAPGREEVDEDV